MPDDETKAIFFIRKHLLMNFPCFDICIVCSTYDTNCIKQKRGAENKKKLPYEIV
jgi:hypothetical protein